MRKPTRGWPAYLPSYIYITANSDTIRVMTDLMKKIITELAAVLREEERKSLEWLESNGYEPTGRGAPA